MWPDAELENIPWPFMQSDPQRRCEEESESFYAD